MRVRWNDPAGPVLLALLLSAAGGTAARAHGKPHGQHGGSGHGGVAAAKGAAGVWQQVRGEAGELNETIKAKKLDQVHEIAYEIRDLVRTLPDKTPSVSAANKKKLAADISEVGKVAKLLDKMGDAGDQKGTEEHQEHLHALLHHIASLYPAGALGPPDHGHTKR